MKIEGQDADRPEERPIKISYVYYCLQEKQVQRDGTQDQPLMDIQRSLRTKARRTGFATAWVAEMMHGAHQTYCVKQCKVTLHEGKGLRL